MDVAMKYMLYALIIMPLHPSRLYCMRGGQVVKPPAS